MRFRHLFVLLLCLVPRALAEGLPDLGEAAQSSFTALEERRLGDEIMREIRFYNDVVYLKLGTCHAPSFTALESARPEGN